MALPKMSTPLYVVNLPSTGEKITFRPFLVREEKSLLLAQQSDDMNVMIATLKEIITNCVKEPLNIQSLAIFDIEYLFTQIRAKSVGEFAEIIFTCAYCTDDKNKTQMSIDITKIPVIKDPKHTNKIPLFNDVGVIMKYPNIDTLGKSMGKADDINSIMELVIDCIDVIYTDNEIFHTKDQTRTEVEDFVMNLNKKQFDMLEEFFVTVPKYKQEIEYDCPACGAHNKTILEGTSSFF